MAKYSIPERQWEPPQPKPNPEPEVWAQPAEHDEIPRGAARILALAENHGWAPECNYARGTKAGRVPKVVDSIAVLAQGGGRAFWAVWVDGKFHAAQVVEVGKVARSVGLAGVKAFIKEES